MSDNANERPDVSEGVSSKRKLALSEQALIALVLGIVVGLFFGELDSVLKMIGDIFDKLFCI